MLSSLRLHSCCHRCTKLFSSYPAARAAGSRFATFQQWGQRTPGPVQAAAKGFARQRAFAELSTTTKLPGLTAAELVNTYRWPLLAAATQQRWEVCQQLLDMGVSDPQDVRQVAAWYAAHAGRAQLAVALLKSASAVPLDAGMGSDHGSDGDAAEVTLESKVLHQAWSRALSRKDVNSCRVLLQHFPGLLRHSKTKSAMERSPDKGVVDFLLEACLQHGDSAQQLHSDLLQAALKGAAETRGSRGSDLLRALLDKGADVNAGQQAFTGDSPLAAATQAGHTTNTQILLAHGAHVHADQSGRQAKSALTYAIKHSSVETCTLLLSDERVQVGEEELCAAVERGKVDWIDLVLQAEARLKPTFRACEEQRGAWLKKALALAVQKCAREWDDPDHYIDVFKALLAPPAHWYPLPLDLLHVCMGEVLAAIKEHGVSKELCEVVKVLGKAGADLSIEKGALLMAAIQAHKQDADLGDGAELLEQLVLAGADIGMHGAAALRAADSDKFASLLLKAGVPVEPEEALCRKLLGMVICRYSDDLGPLLGALDKTGVASKEYLTAPKPQPAALELLSSRRWPLLAAATQEKWEVCEQLLGMGASDPPYVKYVAAWYAANAGQAQLFTALLQSASMPTAGGSGTSRSQPTAAAPASAGTDGDCSSDEDGDEISLEFKVLSDAWSQALTRGDLATCRALLDFCPYLLSDSGTRYAAERGKLKEVEFLLEPCVQRGACQQQVYSDLLQAALKGAAQAGGSRGSDLLRALLDQGADVNAGQQAFTDDSPLAAALSGAWGDTQHVQVLLDHGAHVHGDPTRLRSKSALQYAIERCSVDACKVLLSCERVQVGRAELCAAAKEDRAGKLQLVLAAEGNLKPSSKSDPEERGRWLKMALAIAVRSAEGESYYCETCECDIRRPRENEQTLEALLNPPAHWHPLPPALLAVGVKEVLRVVKKHGVSRELGEVVEALGKAGADLNAEEGALLMAAAKAESYNRFEFLEALLRGGLDVRIHGDAALRAAPDPQFAAELIRAGVPVSSDPDLRMRLMELAAGSWYPTDLGALLGAVDKDGVVVKDCPTREDDDGGWTYWWNSEDDDASSDDDKSEDDGSEMSEDE